VARAKVTPPAPAAVTGWIVLPVIAAVMLFAPVPHSVVDQYYSRGMYPILQRWLTWLSNLIPFALLDLLILLCVILTVRSVLRIVAVARHRSVVDAAWETVRRVVRAAALLTFVFLWTWGFNYRRVPLEATLGPGLAAQLTPEMLQAAISDGNVLATRLRPAAAPGAVRDFDETASELREPMARALAQLNQVQLGTPGRPKFSLILTPFFTLTGVDGMIDPVLLESIVHPDLLPFERPFVLAHEWAHLAGRADEAEASAVGWLACMNGGPAPAYSASLYLIMQARAELPFDAQQAVTRRLDPGVRSDLDAITDRLAEENATMQRAATRVYDRYLRANGVSDGAQSYSRALTLILSPPFHDAMSNYRAGGNPHP
jgi:Protein of unknown function (DUF3810)